MRTTIRNSHISSEERKIRKPLMEKKRRTRINESLEQLKNFLLECDPETATWRHGQRSNKLEKADILELTVKFLQNYHLRMQQNQGSAFLPSGSSWTNGNSFPTHVAVSMNGDAGGQVFFGAAKQPSEPKCEPDEEVWRPW